MVGNGAIIIAGRFVALSSGSTPVRMPRWTHDDLVASKFDSCTA